MKRKKRKLDIRKIIFVIIVLFLIVCGLVKIKQKVAQDEQIKGKSKQISVEDIVIEQVNENKEEVNISELSEKQLQIKKKRLEEGKVLSDSGLPVLMYHFFYNESKGEKGEDGNWIEISEFESQIKYLTENEYYFPTWTEVEEYIDGKDLPEKSVVITVDDGDASFFDLAVPVIQKYDAYATSFVITGWYGYRADEKEKNIYYESHSNDMHKAGKNGKGVMLSWDAEKIKEDAETSSQILGGATIFCYPFGQFNETNFNTLKQAGFNLAFTTKGGRVKKGSEKYKLPRVRVSAGTSLKAFASKVN